MIYAKDFYLLRSPFLPVNFLDRFNGVTHAQLEGMLKAVFTDKALQEAIYLASPELFREMDKWMGGQLAVKDANKLVLSLFRYLLRMCARCTPYGLFAGCAMGEFSMSTSIVMDDAEKHRKHSRLDMNYVAELSAMVSELPEVREQAYYYPNSSLYKVGGKYRYAEFTLVNKYRTYNLTGIEWSAYLEKIISRAITGARLQELADCITGDGIGSDEAAAFIQELVEHQVLVSELEPTVTGGECLIRLIASLEALNNTAGITAKLRGIYDLLRQSPGIPGYLQTHAVVNELLPDTNSRDLVQTDLFLATTQNIISSTVIKDIQGQVEKLWCLSRLHNGPDLQSFREAFTARFDQQEVPLELVLDTEAGIGYGAYTSAQAGYTPLVDDIVTGNSRVAGTVTWNKMLAFQVKRLNTCLFEQGMEIELTDADLDELKEPGLPKMPDSVYLMGSLLGSSAEAIDAGDFQFDLKTCGGPSAATLLGRFCPGDDKLLGKVRSCLREEEAHEPECIYAEVVHLPQARTGNILLRPTLRDYEIVYLGKGSVAPERQILLSDLMVSVRNDTVILRSKRLNKRVLPRLSTAHNFRAGSLPVYQFLCDLQFQQLHGALGWHWNVLTEVLFLPRVRYKKIILSKCTWVLRKKDYPDLPGHQKGSATFDYMGWMQRIRSRLKLPQHVLLVDGDNELYLNLENESCLHILADTLSKDQRVMLQEFLGTANRCFAQGKQGKFVNEIIVPFSRDKVLAGTPGGGLSSHENRYAAGVRSRNEEGRSFDTGSEWLYVKIYCGTNSAERILKEHIKPITSEFLEAGIIDKWFFIRYADPGSHIRIRFHHPTNKDFWKVVLERLYHVMKPEIDNASVYKIQTDTYEREIERYGMNTIVYTEDLFYHDSEAVIRCLDLLGGDEGENYRWLLAARGVDMLLTDFGYSPAGKSALLKKLQASSFAEFGAEKNLQTRLNEKYREKMRLLDSFLDKEHDLENGIEEAVALFEMRSRHTRRAVEGIRQWHESINGQAQAPDQWTANYIHMFLNRMLLSDHRRHELVIYHFLSKHYDSRIARQKLRQQGAPDSTAILQ